MGKEQKPAPARRLMARYGENASFSCKDMIVLRGQKSVTLHGCRRILLYAPREIRVCVGRGAVAVEGCSLVCTCFSAGSVTVEGRIDGIRFLREQGKKGEADKE